MEFCNWVAPVAWRLSAKMNNRMVCGIGSRMEPWYHRPASAFELCILPFFLLRRSLPRFRCSCFSAQFSPNFPSWLLFFPLAFGSNLFACNKRQNNILKMQIRRGGSYIADGHKMAIKKTKINGNIRVGINSLWEHWSEKENDKCMAEKECNSESL